MRSTSKAFKLTYTIIDIRLDGGDVEILPAGMYALRGSNDTYVMSNWGAADIHIEVFTAAAWRDLIYTSADQNVMSDGTNVRVANGAAPTNFRRAVGVRMS